jgi:site-specific DNA recombinase
VRAVVYVRVSTEDQARHGYSLDAQREACRARALEKGATEILEFADEGVSGEVMERPALRKALEAVKEGAALFVCLDPDRLSRKLAHQLVLTEEIEKAGCRLEFVNFDWQDTPEGRLFYSMKGAIAEYEREKIVARSRMGKVAKAKRGEKAGKLRIYGYREEPGCLIPKEPEASVVRQIFAWAAAGDGPYVIAGRLTEAGVPGPGGGKWYRAAVARILKNTAYVGVVYQNRYDCSGLSKNRFLPPDRRLKRREKPQEEWVPLAVPAIVDKVTWERAQAARARRHRMITERYLLSGLVYCGECGLPMWGTSYKAGGRRSRRYRYYLCAARKNYHDRKVRPACCSSYVHAEPLEEVVWSVVAGWLCRPEALLEEMRRPERRAEIEEQMRAVAAELKAAQAERKRAFAAYARGLVDEESYAEVAREIKTRAERLSGRLARLQEELAAVEPGPEDREAMRKLAVEYAGRAEDLSFEEKSRLVHLLVERIVVAKNRVEITGRVPREVRHGATPTVVSVAPCHISEDGGKTGSKCGSRRG